MATLESCLGNGVSVVLGVEDGTGTMYAGEVALVEVERAEEIVGAVALVTLSQTSQTKNTFLFELHDSGS